MTNTTTIRKDNYNPSLLSTFISSPLIMKLISLLVIQCIVQVSSSSSSNNYYKSCINPISIGIRSAMTKSSSPLVQQLSTCNNQSNSNNWSNKFVTSSKSRRRGFASLDTYNSNHSNQFVVSTNMKQSSSSSNVQSNTMSRGGGNSAAAASAITTSQLNFWENMICGAISRSVAQIVTHPANTMKTLLQSNRNTSSSSQLTLKSIAKMQNIKMLSRGAGAQLILSIPHGAVNFAVLEYVRSQMNVIVNKSSWARRQRESNNKLFGPAMDFSSSAVATVCCSVVSTPQMMIVDNIMAGTYPNLVTAVKGLSAEKGVSGFYSGWWPGLAGKIPSYGLTWTFFQQFKQIHQKLYQRPAKDFENSIMGCMASATTVCIMIPMDTIKTRLVTQRNYPHLVPYKGIVDAAVRITREEGIGTFYRGLPPRLISVVPMVGIQFGTYEFMKKFMLSRQRSRGDNSIAPSERGGSKKKMKDIDSMNGKDDNEKCHRIESVIMEVAADDDQPFPVPELRDYNESDAGNKKSMQSKIKAFTRKL